MNFETVAEGVQFPEGPIAMPDGSVLFVEMIPGTLTRAWGNGRKEVVAQVGEGPNGAALGPDGAVYICNNGGVDITRNAAGDLVFGPVPRNYTGGHIDRVDLATGRVERLYEYCNGFRLSAPNDLVFDRQGGMWFTDMGRPIGRSRTLSGLYYAKADGSSITEAYFGASAYNGVGLSPDERMVYVSDTYTARIWSFELESPGRIKPPADPHGPARFVASLNGNISIDSFALTASGKLCVATFGTGGIATIDPDGPIEHLPLPDHFVTNICFGGQDMRTAHITLVHTGRVLRTQWPEPGMKLNFCPY
jgi:gluconolactonase